MLKTMSEFASKLEARLAKIEAKLSSLASKLTHVVVRSFSSPNIPEMAKRNSELNSELTHLTRENDWLRAKLDCQEHGETQSSAQMMTSFESSLETPPLSLRSASVQTAPEERRPKFADLLHTKKKYRLATAQLAQSDR